MKKQKIREQINTYADQILGGGAGDWDDDSVGDSLLTDLLWLTNELAALLVPVNPSPTFIRKLGADLAAAAAPSEIEIAKPSRRKLWIGAILSGSLVSVLGVLFVWLMRKSRRSSVVAVG